jgi:excisionase family DNA binding protein
VLATPELIVKQVLRGMATARRFERHNEQLELAPRIGLSEPLLPSEKAAELLSVKASWIYEACRTGRLPFLRVGKHLRFTRSDLECWLTEQRCPGRPPDL